MSVNVPHARLFAIGFGGQLVPLRWEARQSWKTVTDRHGKESQKPNGFHCGQILSLCGSVSPVVPIRIYFVGDKGHALAMKYQRLLKRRDKFRDVQIVDGPMPEVAELRVLQEAEDGKG